MRHVPGALLVLCLGLRQECAAAPPPMVAGVSPDRIMVRTPALKISVTGSGFTTDSTVVLDSMVLATKLESPTELSAVIPAARLMDIGLLPVSVSGPGGNSNSVPFFVVSDLAPALTAISPGFGRIGTTVNATLSGTNLLGATSVTIGGTGVSVSVGIGTPVSLPISIAIAGNATPGLRTVTVTTPAGSSNAYSGFLIGGAPVITEGGVLPLFGKALTMSINGHFFDSDSTVWVNGIHLTSTFVSESRLNVLIPGSMMMLPGSLPVQVLSASGMASNTAFLRVVQRGDINGDSTVNIGDALALALAAGGSKAPLLNSVGDINLNGLTNVGDALVVALFAGGITSNLPAPEIVSVNSSRITLSSTITLTTTGMPGAASNYRVLFRNANADLVSVSPTLSSAAEGKWDVLVPAEAVSGTIQIERLDPPLVGGEFPLVIETSEAPLALISVNPFARVSIGASIVLRGTGFDSNAAGDVVRFRSSSGTVTGLVTNATSTSLTVVVPSDAQCGPVTVGVGTRTSNARSITISGSLCPLVLSDFASAGSPGDILILDGVRFDTATPSNNVVRFQTATGTTVATVLQSGMTQLLVRIPDDAVDGDVTVSQNTQTSNPKHFHAARTLPQ